MASQFPFICFPASFLSRPPLSSLAPRPSTPSSLPQNKPAKDPRKEEPPFNQLPNGGPNEQTGERLSHKLECKYPLREKYRWRLKRKGETPCRIGFLCLLHGRSNSCSCSIAFRTREMFRFLLSVGREGVGHALKIKKVQNSVVASPPPDDPFRPCSELEINISLFQEALHEGGRGSKNGAASRSIVGYEMSEGRSRWQAPNEASRQRKHALLSTLSFWKIENRMCVEDDGVEKRVFVCEHL